MNKLKIVKNLKQIKELLEEDAPIMATERIKWLISDIEKDLQILSEDDIKYRQGRTQSQVESNYKIMEWTLYGLVFVGGIILLNALFG
jgi:hypothetical protein